MTDKIDYETHLKYKHPFCMTVAGPSQCGKTKFILDLLADRNSIIYPIPTRIKYCYSVWQCNFDDLKISIPTIEFCKGIPDLEDNDSLDNNLIVLDDLMSECIDNKNILQLFTIGSHHKNISVIFLTQNIFCKGKHSRSINLNSHYLILFRNPRDASQINHLGRQLYPKNTKYFEEAFNDAISTPYGYLIVDLKQDTPEDLRLRSVIARSKVFVYLKKIKE